jgi:hypothetical protein
LKTVRKNSKIEYEFINENALFIKASGVFDIESVHKSFEALNNQPEGKRKVHVISDYLTLRMFTTIHSKVNQFRLKG